MFGRRVSLGTFLIGMLRLSSVEIMLVFFFRLRFLVRNVWLRFVMHVIVDLMMFVISGCPVCLALVLVFVGLMISIVLSETFIIKFHVCR